MNNNGQSQEATQEAAQTNVNNEQPQVTTPKAAQTKYVSANNNITFIIPENWKDYNYDIADNKGDIRIKYISSSGVKSFLFGLVRDNLEDWGLNEDYDFVVDISGERWYVAFRGAMSFSPTEAERKPIDQMDSDFYKIVLPSVRGK